VTVIQPPPIAYDKAIRAFSRCVRKGRVEKHFGDLRLGVDLGTANIVLSVVDARNRPVAGAWQHSTVVRDGVVVDWRGAVTAVGRLKDDLEARLKHRFTTAAVAIPPAIPDGFTKVFTNVLEACGLEVAEVVDEPVAAARVLGITDGCVIDVGHGTTGVSVLSGGEVITSVDEATGGHHMTLVLAGAYRLPYDEAEEMKKSKERQPDVLGVIRPTLEKMATIAAAALRGLDTPMIYLVGGSSSFANAPEVFAQVLGRPVVRPVEPLFVTTLGIAMTP
jgi:ethanolamine utilization protein EutJ